MDRQPHELIGGWRSLSSKEVILDSRLSDRGQVEPPSETVRRLSLPFTNLQLLSRALTHRSYINEHPEALEDNERLEFLGDAVLDFIVGAWLYNRFPEMSEGDLTRLRSALVRTEQLAEFAQNMNLGPEGRNDRLFFAEPSKPWSVPSICKAVSRLLRRLFSRFWKKLVSGLCNAWKCMTQKAIFKNGPNPKDWEHHFMLLSARVDRTTPKNF